MYMLECLTRINAICNNWKEKNISIHPLNFWRIEYTFFTDIDDCSKNSCEHGGTCIDGVNSYTCQCIPGYSGHECQTGFFIIVFLLVTSSD